jgi:hypothetical protein
VAIPRSSADYYRRQQRILARVMLAVRQAWRRMDPEAAWSEQYEEDGIGAQLLMIVAAAQVAAARDADAYIAEVLVELALAPSAEPGIVIPSAFAGVAGDGRPVESLLGLAVPRAGQAFNARRRADAPPAVEPEKPDDVSEVLWDSLMRERQQREAEGKRFDHKRAAEESLADMEKWLEAVSASMVIDAARAAETAAAAARDEVTGYVRMLNPPSCSRCVVLAGKFYRWNDGFDRHPPTCDCRHIPVNESIAEDLTVNPDRYFWSLSPADQDKTFGKANAQAIRDGADIAQVVNARRGMQRAQVGGRDVVISTEGTTRFGLAYRGRTGRNATWRLMPESIYDIAGDNRDEATRLLRLAGFII